MPAKDPSTSRRTAKENKTERRNTRQKGAVREVDVEEEYDTKMDEAHGAEIEQNETVPDTSKSSTVEPAQEAVLTVTESTSSSALDDVSSQYHEKQRLDAIISFNTIDLSDPPATPLFGVYNPRNIRPPAVTALAKTLAFEAFTPFATNCMFPIVIPKDLIDPSCITRIPSIDGSMPRLVLRSKVKSIGFCGGQHRMDAVKKALELLKLKIDQGEQELAKANRNKDELLGGEDVRLANLASSIKDWQARSAELNIWGCIVYDRAKTDVGELGAYLSANTQEVKAVADPLEAFHMDMQRLVRRKTEVAVAKFLSSYENTTNNFHAILRHKSLRILLTRLYNAGPQFYMSPPMHPAWIAKHYLGTYGGMLGEIINYGLSAYEALLSPRSIKGLKSEKVAQYFKKLEAEDIDEREKARLFKISTPIWEDCTSDVGGFKCSFLQKDFWDTIDSKNKDMFMPLIDHLFNPADDDFVAAMREYVEDVKKEFSMALMLLNTSDDEDEKIKDSMDDKLHWLLTNHEAVHYAPVVPLMTPSTILLYVELFSRMPNALLEFCSWICPIAYIDVKRAKAPTDSRDVSVVAIESLLANRTKMFMSQCLPAVARTFAFFPIKYAAVFHQLEADLSEIDPALMRRSHRLESTALEQMEMSEEQVAKEAEDLKKWMMQNRQTDIVSWHSKVWALNVEGYHTWRGTGGKNNRRDFEIGAIMALNEQHMAMKYRPQLLQTSVAAQWLRQEFKRAMSVFCLLWKVKIDDKVVSMKEYQYPDKLESPAVAGPPDVDIEELKRLREVSVEEAKAVKDFASLLGKLQRAKFLHASPRDNVINDDVRTAIDMLAKAGRMNIKRQAVMRRHMADEGDDDDDKGPGSFDPTDPKYDVAELTRAELTFYSRTDGFSERRAKKASTEGKEPEKPPARRTKAPGKKSKKPKSTAIVESSDDISRPDTPNTLAVNKLQECTISPQSSYRQGDDGADEDDPMDGVLRPTTPVYEDSQARDDDDHTMEIGGKRDDDDDDDDDDDTDVGAVAKSPKQIGKKRKPNQAFSPGSRTSAQPEPKRGTSGAKSTRRAGMVDNGEAQKVISEDMLLGGDGI